MGTVSTRMLGIGSMNSVIISGSGKLWRTTNSSRCPRRGMKIAKVKTRRPRSE
jgi:hypothetical protein